MMLYSLLSSLLSFSMFTGLFSLNLRIDPLYGIGSSVKGTEKLFSLKYRGKVLEGEVAEAAEEIICETCKELDLEKV